MSNVGQIERKTQERVLALFQELKYDYLGNWEYRENNSNVEVNHLTKNLRNRGYDNGLISKTIDKLKSDASLGGGRDLYEANRDVYGLLRYGVHVKVSESRPTLFGSLTGTIPAPTTLPLLKRSPSLEVILSALTWSFM